LFHPLYRIVEISLHGYGDDGDDGGEVEKKMFVLGESS